jgi:hypothetical protein
MQYVRVRTKKLIAADTDKIVPNNTMTDIAARPPQSPRFRRHRPTGARSQATGVRRSRGA